MTNQDKATLINAVLNGEIEIVRTILNSGGNPNERDNLQRPLIISAVAKGYIEILRLMLLHVANPNIASEDGETPLLVACKCRDAEAVKILLRAGANPNLQLKIGSTPLTYAATTGDIKIVSLLIKGGALIYAKGISGKTPLHKAVESGHFEVVEFLLKERASPNIQCDAGMTPLMQAATSGDHKIFELLLDHGADANIKDKNNATAFDCSGKGFLINPSMKLAFEKIQKLLLEYPDREKKRFRDKEALHQLLDRQAEDIFNYSKKRDLELLERLAREEEKLPKFTPLPPFNPAIGRFEQAREELTIQTSNEQWIYENVNNHKCRKCSKERAGKNYRLIIARWVDSSSQTWNTGISYTVQRTYNFIYVNTVSLFLCKRCFQKKFFFMLFITLICLAYPFFIISIMHDEKNQLIGAICGMSLIASVGFASAMISFYPFWRKELEEKILLKLNKKKKVKIGELVEFSPSKWQEMSRKKSEPKEILIGIGLFILWLSLSGFLLWFVTTPFPKYMGFDH